MVEIQGINLIITNKCNAFCKHCGSDCGPEEDETMTIGDVKLFIDTAKRIQSLKLICFTGGEPLLFYDKVVEAMNYACELGLRSEIVTNCFWAKSYKIALEKIAVLKENGLTNFVTSFDDFHIEYISPNCIENAVKAALDLGLKVIIKTLEYENCKIKAEDVYELLDICDKNSNLTVQKISPVSEGRFKYINNENKLDDLKDDSMSNYNSKFSGGCSKIIKFPTVNPLGELYPCCGFGGKSRLVGKYPENDFDELLSMMQNNLLFNLLEAIGPYGVFNLIKRHLNEPIDLDFEEPCELCNFLYSTEEVRDAVYKTMKSIIKI